MVVWFGRFSAVALATIVASGCVGNLGVSSDGNGEEVSAVAAKAITVAEQIGGANGFGGGLMEGFLGHMPGQMGFLSESDLAGAANVMMVRIHNESDEGGTFHLSYFASHMGVEEQLMDVEVGAGEVLTVELPCSEIVGLGPLEMPGEAGCHLANGEVVDNRMAVPGFLGTDFTCGAAYECFLTQDVDDLDGDGDTEELIILTEAMQLHMTEGGPTGHMHGTGTGMMGPHFFP